MNERILPSYPLFVNDPNFSLWSSCEILNSVNVKSWWGETKKIYGTLKTQEGTFCFLGNAAEDFANSDVKNAEQIAVSITAFSTDYIFKAGKVKLKIRFVSPILPNDFDLISLPVCYMEYEVEGDGFMELSFFVNRAIAYNDIAQTVDKRVKCGVLRGENYETAFIGLSRQMPLSTCNDLIGADWGYYYLTGESAYALDESSLAVYLACGNKNVSVNGVERYIGSINRATSGRIMMAYDDLVSIEYFGEYLKGYYLENHTIAEALEFTFKNAGTINAKLQEFDEKLQKKAKNLGAEYLNVLYASLRQSIAAHKLVKDKDGNILFLSKECNSNGCIGTVDVSYPSMPLFLLYNPELVKGMLRPIFKFARMPVWTYDFAPHDVGTYPSCCGQVYGLKSGAFSERDYSVSTHYPVYSLPANFDAYDFNMQMPVEECANVLIMLLAIYRKDGDISFFADNQDLCSKWVEYLVKYGLRPENQLCTDDFAGHLKNNLNLSIKAIVGLAAYAELSGETRYRKTAEGYAKEIMQFVSKFAHSPLTWDSGEETFSLKYNLAYDKILGLGLFPQSFLEKEIDFYLTKATEYAVPLDNRNTYAKSDWLMWVAALTDDIDKKKQFITLLDNYLKKVADRNPFPDWYDSNTGKRYWFRNRTVQGGCFILL